MFGTPVLAMVAAVDIAIAGVLGAFDVGTSLQVLVGLVGLSIALAVGSSKRKDATISDFRTALEGASARADSEHEARQDAERAASELRGKVEMLERYAAPQAFKQIDHTLGELRATIVGSISAQGELILKNTELVSSATRALERVADDLEGLAGRIHPEKLEQLVTDFARLAEVLGASGERPPGAV